MNMSEMEGLFAAHMAGETKRRNQLIDSTKPGLNWLTGTGDPTESPLYSSLLSKSRESISNSYDNAVMGSRASAHERGFGYESPASQAGELGVRAQEAGALSSAPREALLGTIQPMMQAQQLRTEQASQYRPVNWASGMTELEKARAAAKASLYGSLAKLAGSVIGGVASMGMGGLGDSYQAMMEAGS